jgi:hypothetical protein
LGIDPPILPKKTLIWGGYGRGEGLTRDIPQWGGGLRVPGRPPGIKTIINRESPYDKMTIPNKVINI